MQLNVQNITFSLHLVYYFCNAYYFEKYAKMYILFTRLTGLFAISNVYVHAFFGLLLNVHYYLSLF